MTRDNNSRGNSGYSVLPSTSIGNPAFGITEMNFR